MMDVAGLKVLLVEDEYLIALDAEQMLRDLGAEDVEILSTFESAHAYTQTNQFDIAVLDVNINGQFSFPIAETLQRRGIPMVFATGYSLRERPMDGFSGGVYVGKPYTMEGLRKALVAALTAQANQPADQPGASV